MQRVTSTLSSRPALNRGCRIEVIAGADAGSSWLVPQIGVVVGADPGCDVLLHDPAVSGRHFQVVPSRNGFEVTDLGSRNGTFLDETLVSRVVVPPGTTLRTGTTVLQLLPAEELVEIPPSAASGFGGLIGSSLAMRRIYGALERASGSDASILLGGESGTGKELAARAIHDHSGRKSGPFVVFDCGAASDTLIESDLFGHLRGAFTGAQSDRDGAFAAADGGTLFLDEIGDLPIGLQPKLLRMLEGGEVVPLGGRKPVRADVRVIAATHRDLWREVGRGTFRGDLYYRLAVVEAEIPPLRRRTEDISELAELFLRRAGATDPHVQGKNLDSLVAYPWPGNVRELRNVMARAVALSPTGASFDDMPILLRNRVNGGSGQAGAGAPVNASGSLNISWRADRNYHDVKAELLARFERDYLSDLITRAEGNVSQAARTAGLERKYLYKLLEKADLLPARKRGASGSDENQAADESDED
jgi:DNA-binding NtrC family response regulator